MNKVIMLGRLTADPVLSKLPNGTDKCEFRIAVNREWKKDGKKETCYIDVITWSRQAVNCEAHLAKGLRVIIDGRLDYQEWGQPKKSKHVVTAQTVTFVDWKDQS